MIYKSIKLGQMLVSQGILSKEDLAIALEKQKDSKKKLGELLVSEGFVQSKTLIEFLSKQLDIAYVDLDKVETDNKMAAVISEGMARSYSMVPLKKDGRNLVIAMSDPLDFAAIKNIESFTKSNIKVVIAEKEKIDKKIKQLYSFQKATKAAMELTESTVEKEVIKIGETESSEPIVRFINNMFENAIIMKASDIHIEPMEKKLRIRFRIDGHLTVYMETDSEITPLVVSRIKIIGNMNIAEKRLPQDGRLSYMINNINVDLRISVLPSTFGEKIVIRITNTAGFELKKENLGFTKKDTEKFTNLINSPHGIILVTGATGSGKTTTLYTAMQEIKRDDINIVTIEDPVEITMAGITQVQVNSKAGLTFAEALRSILRQDPDVIMVGEIRDTETAKIAVSAAVTGHLVFSTLHTYDAPSSIIRLIDMGVEPYMVSPAVMGVIAQRLMTKICLNCKVGYTATPAQLDILGIENTKDVTLYKGQGCPVCNFTGYKGRTAICEIMPMTPALRDAVHFMENFHGIRKIAISEGMITLEENAKQKVLSGEVSFEELLGVLALNN